MRAEEILEKLAESIAGCDPERARSMAEEALKANVSSSDAIFNGLVKGMTVVGEKYGKGEYFLAELIMAGEAMHEALNILMPMLDAEKGGFAAKGRVVIGTVEGDIHDIGKSLVAGFLRAAGYEVHDLGVDVSVQQFVEKAREVDADIAALSALLSTTVVNMTKVIEALKKAGLRDRVNVIIGGAPCDGDLARKIGADGYGGNAYEAVRIADELMKSGRSWRRKRK